MVVVRGKEGMMLGPGFQSRYRESREVYKRARRRVRKGRE